MTSTGAALAVGPLPELRRWSADGLAPVFHLPQHRPPPATLLDLLKKLDARAPSPLPGEPKSDHFYKVATCGEYFYRARCGCGKRLLPKTCGDRLCPHCERRRAARAARAYSRCFEGRKWARLLTLTVRRFELGELEESIDFFVKAFRKLRHRNRAAFQGGVYSIETKGKPPGRDSRGGWHTHVHALLWGDYGEHPRLALQWVEATGGRVDWDRFDRMPKTTKLRDLLKSVDEPFGCVELEGRGRVVDIRAARPDSDGGYDSALREVLKYVTKSPAGARSGEEATAGWTVDMLDEFYRAVKNRRLLNKFGACPKVGEVPERPCERCGERIHIAQGRFAQCLNREDGERWAATPDPVHDDGGGWSLAMDAAYRRELELFNGKKGPGP